MGVIQIGSVSDGEGAACFFGIAAGLTCEGASDHERRAVEVHWAYASEHEGIEMSSISSRGALRLAALLTVSNVHAQTSGSDSSSPAGVGISLGLLIAYLARQNPIGGWLLYF